MKGISIIIPTYNGGAVFKKLLQMIKQQKYEGEIQVIVIDSGSNDGTCQEAINANADLIRINNKDFHHSRTRNQALLQVVHPYVVLMVQDAIPLTNQWLNNLVNSIEKENVVGVYGRQIPHDDADLYAKFAVDNHAIYLGEKTNIQKIDSPDEFNKLSYEQALFRIRFDNVCAIYNCNVLLEHQIPEVSFAEDMAWALDVMKKGYKIKYDPAIMVSHSHNRNKEYHFKRAIVDNLHCIKILRKEPENLSRWTATDLVLLRDIMNEIVSDMLEHIRNKDICKIRTVDPHLTKLLLLKLARMCRGTILFFASSPFFKPIDALIKKQMLTVQMNNMLKLVLDRYPNNNNYDDLNDFIEKMGAAIVGNYWGRVYGSYELRGCVPRDIKELVKPYLTGV